MAPNIAVDEYKRWEDIKILLHIGADVYLWPVINLTVDNK